MSNPLRQFNKIFLLAYGKVFLVRKIRGPDRGHLYAMKVGNHDNLKPSQFKIIICRCLKKQI